MRPAQVVLGHGRHLRRPGAVRSEVGTDLGTASDCKQAPISTRSARAHSRAQRTAHALDGAGAENPLSTGQERCRSWKDESTMSTFEMLVFSRRIPSHQSAPDQHGHQAGHGVIPTTAPADSALCAAQLDYGTRRGRGEVEPRNARAVVKRDADAVVFTAAGLRTFASRPRARCRSRCRSTRCCHVCCHVCGARRRPGRHPRRP